MAQLLAEFEKVAAAQREMVLAAQAASDAVLAALIEERR